MARPERNTVDYFPLYCKDGKGMFYIEQKYGNDGYATWLKILCQLATTDYHYIDLSNEIQFMFLSAKCRIDKKVLESIINDLVILGEFDNELWNDNKIIFSEKFILSIKDAYDKRNNDCINRNSLIQLLISLGVRKQPKSSTKPLKCNSEDTVKPQTIVDYTKEEETKVYRAFAHLSISIDEFNKLLELNYSKENIDTVLDKIQNFKKNKNYTSLYLTSLNWLKSEFNNTQPKQSINTEQKYKFQLPVSPTTHEDRYETIEMYKIHKSRIEAMGGNLKIILPENSPLINI